ncbi:ParA family protein [Myxococcota bacterium]|nr:ParA family protein [Myxococcota bacterium]
MTAHTGVGEGLGPRRIALINEKGGSAKTTLVASFASYLALHRGRRVLAIDMDPQGQLGKVLGVETRRSTRSAIDMLLDTVLGERPSDPNAPERSPLPISPTRTPNLDVIGSNKSLAFLPALRPESGASETSELRRALDDSAEINTYDFVFFDAPPSFGALTLNVLCAADEVVIPVPLTYLAMDGCAELLRTIAEVRSRYGNPALQISMVVPTFYRRTRMANEILAKLKSRFPKEIAQSVIGYHVKIDEAQSRGLSIFEYAPRDRAARTLAELTEELELRGRDFAELPRPVREPPTP